VEVEECKSKKKKQDSGVTETIRPDADQPFKFYVQLQLQKRSTARGRKRDAGREMRSKVVVD